MVEDKIAGCIRVAMSVCGYGRMCLCVCVCSINCLDLSGALSFAGSTVG